MIIANIPEDAIGDEVVTVDASWSIKLDKQDAASAASFQVLAAKLLSGDTDILICEEDLFLKEQENNAFLPLEDLLTEEEIKMMGEIETVDGQAYGLIIIRRKNNEGTWNIFW